MPDRLRPRLPRLPHPAFVCSGPQLNQVIADMAAGRTPLPEEDGVLLIVWRSDLPREQAIHLARVTGGTEEQIAAQIAEDDGGHGG